VDHVALDISWKILSTSPAAARSRSPNVKAEAFSLDLKNVAIGWVTSAAVGKDLYTFGSEANRNVPSGVFMQSQVFNVDAKAWKLLDHMPVPHRGFATVPVSSDKIYIPSGGLQQDGTLYLVDGVDYYFETTEQFAAYVVSS